VCHLHEECHRRESGNTTGDLKAVEQFARQGG
jgi:hypothetical protein